MRKVTLFALMSFLIIFSATLFAQEKTVDVDVKHLDGKTAIVSGNLKEGDMVITTRLSESLENTLLIHNNEDGLQTSGSKDGNS